MQGLQSHDNDHDLNHNLSHDLSHHHQDQEMTQGRTTQPLSQAVHLSHAIPELSCKTCKSTIFTQYFSPFPMSDIRWKKSIFHLD